MDLNRGLRMSRSSLRMSASSPSMSLRTSGETPSTNSETQAKTSARMSLISVSTSNTALASSLVTFPRLETNASRMGTTLLRLICRWSLRAWRALSKSSASMVVGSARSGKASVYPCERISFSNHIRSNSVLITSTSPSRGSFTSATTTAALVHASTTAGSPYSAASRSTSRLILFPEIGPSPAPCRVECLCSSSSWASLRCVVRPELALRMISSDS
ncbi:hypothetical protein B0T14DRAFT_526618 [Immersiella caudata]|uniref:Uncharacterized protein n=1 Tax=Immersiella caudata TaxID=314043 RepID=A0AA39WDY9_9PEZI|nr:hypothetical protein B0T14DRAFT_526618 [Immersiella caudata]